MYAVDLNLEKITEDAEPYRDTIYLIADGIAEHDIETAVLKFVTDNDIAISELAMSADQLDWSDIPLTPAAQDRDTFLSLVDVLPSSEVAFGNIAYVFIDIDDL